MDKPDDISQEAWDRSETVIIDLEEHVDFSNDGRITDKYMDRQYAKAQAIIARAIMAAKAEEREACAIAVYDATDFAHEDRDIWLKEEIAAAIRARNIQ